MAILIDVLFAALLLGFLVVGLRMGLIRSLVGFVGSTAALIAAILLGNLFAGWIYTGIFRPPMVDQISGAVASQSATAQTQTESALAALPGFVSNALQNLGISARQVGQAVAASADPVAQSVADFVSPVVIHLTALALTLLLFLLFRLGVFFIIRLLERFFRLPVLNTLNRLGGAAFGLLKGVLVGVLLATTVLVITPLLSPETANSIQTTIETSYLCRWFYDNNPVRVWFAVEL